MTDDEATRQKAIGILTWAQRLKRVFAIDIETCRRCGGKLRLVASTALTLSLGSSRKADSRATIPCSASRPTTVGSSPPLAQKLDALRALLGEAAMARYDAFATACRPLEHEGSHFHPGMIGVAHAHRGQGHARRLLEAFHDMSRADPESSGVSLSTETERNPPFHEHFGYRVLGRGETPTAGS